MIQVNIANNTERFNKIYDENTTTVRAAFEDCGIDYSVGISSIDGTMLKAGDMDKTFAELGVSETCKLRNVMKMDNAA